MNKSLSQAAAALGRIKTEKKASAARENGKKGGRPKLSGKSTLAETPKPLKCRR